MKLTSSAKLILRELKDRGSCTAGQLLDTLQCAPSYLATLLCNLKTGGYIVESVTKTYSLALAAGNRTAA